VADLNDLTQSRDSAVAQVKLYLGLLRGKQVWLVRALIGLGASFVIVLILADTVPGQVLVTGVVAFVHLFFSWIIGLLIAIAVLVVVVIATAIYLDRKGGRVRIEEDE
jgi:predicted outer membrane lipoprotein